MPGEPLGETTVAFVAPAESEFSSAQVGPSTSAGCTCRRQRQVLIALCRPLAQFAFESPATNRQIADEVRPSV